jgi:hypothetical protein
MFIRERSLRVLLGFLSPVAVLMGSAGCATATADYPRRPTAQEIANAEGLYVLEDGYRAHVFGLDEKLYVRIGAGPQKKLMLVGPGRFASPDGRVSIEFQPGREGDEAQRVVVGYYRDPDGHPPRIFSTGPLPGRGFLD